MHIVLSPAKRLNEKSNKFEEYSLPRNAARTRELIQVLRTYSAGELQDLMHINPKLADLNVGRYWEFKQRHTLSNSLQSLFAFNGDAFLGLDAKSLDDDSLKYGQEHLRILSGLYGILRPLDLIQAYRLEMGTKLKVGEHKNLYEFWGDRNSKMLRSDMRRNKSKILLNLASNEYYKTLDPKILKARIITVNFRENIDGELKFYPVFGKKARGLMTRYVLQNRITDPEELKGFNLENYYFDEGGSTENELLFVR